MLQVEYKGIQGFVVGEQSIEGMPFITWYIKLSDGRLIEVMMHEVTILAESVDLTSINVA